MAEYIEREKAQDGLDNIDWYHVNDKGQLLPGGKSDIETYVPFKAVEEMLKSIPAADVRPVVLCKDCKYWETDWAPRGVSDGRHYCAPLDLYPSDDWFCADGEKREES